MPWNTLRMFVPEGESPPSTLEIAKHILAADLKGAGFKSQ